MAFFASKPWRLLSGAKPAGTQVFISKTRQMGVFLAGTWVPGTFLPKFRHLDPYTAPATM
jgi:hypothetical protein